MAASTCSDSVYVVFAALGLVAALKARRSGRFGLARRLLIAPVGVGLMWWFWRASDPDGILGSNAGLPGWVAWWMIPVLGVGLVVALVAIWADGPRWAARTYGWLVAILVLSPVVAVGNEALQRLPGFPFEFLSTIGPAAYDLAPLVLAGMFVAHIIAMLREGSTSKHTVSV